MSTHAGREDSDIILGSARLSSSRNVVELVRLLARIVAERDYREAQRATKPAARQPVEDE